MIVDVVIPALNEEGNMAALLSALTGTGSQAGWRHVVVCDNGSTDGTAAAARAGGAVVVSEGQRGYGAACLAGLRWIAQQATAPDAVAFVDADLSDDPATLPRLVATMQTQAADLVLGSRRRWAEAGALDPHQRFGNALACVLLQWTTGHRYTDLGPMRVVRWSAMQRMRMADRTWGWTVEMQFKAVKLGLRVVEVDVPYRRRRSGRSKISGSLVGSVRAGTTIISTIGRLWWSSRHGGFQAERVAA